MSDFLDYQEVQEQAFIHAQKLAEREVKNGYQFEYLFSYTNGHGMPVYWKVRAKNHHTGDKWIRVFSSGERGFKFGDPNFTELYPIGQGKKPLYALEHVLSVIEKQPVYIVEGEQKADFLNSLGLTATTCGGSGNTDKTDLKPLAKHAIVIWADNDKAGTKFFNEIAHQLDLLGCDIRYIVLDGLNLPEKGDVMDWAELRKQKGLDITASEITALTTAIYQPPSPSSNLFDGMLCEPMEWQNGCSFEIHDKGVFFIEKQKSGNYAEHFVSSPIIVVAKTRTGASDNWGTLLKWDDIDQVPHTWAVPAELFQGDGQELRKTLANGGVDISPNRQAREWLQNYLSRYPTEKRALCVDSVGWHKGCYVLPNETIGTLLNNEMIVYQHNGTVKNRFSIAGDLIEWQKNVSKLLESHHLFVMSIACAFAGQLLETLGLEGGGIHFKGKSSKGKSTVIYSACSVWGKPTDYWHKWRTTGNALESIAQMHNHGFLALDEIGEYTGKDLGQTVYMLSGGQGKERSGRDGKNQQSKKWNIIYLSSGEETFSEVMKKYGDESKLGQQTRLPDIVIDEREYGTFDAVDFAQNSQEQAELIGKNTHQYYGVAGRAWLEYLTTDKENLDKQAKTLFEQYKRQISPPNDKNGHIGRTASRFAIIAVAGEMATQAGITGWQQGRALQAVQSVFKTWLNSFEMVGDFEDRQILQQVRAFFEANGNSRFDTLIEGNKRASYGNSEHANDANTDTKSFREKTMYRVGYKVVNAQQRETLRYLFFKEQFKQELYTGFDPKKVAKVLKQHGWLDCANGKTTKQERTPESKNPVWLYVFNTSMFSYDIEKATNPYTDDLNTGSTIDI